MKAHPETKLGSVTLKTADLAQAMGFYVEILGMNVLFQGDGQASLGTSERSELVWLVERADLEPRPLRTAGLYHFAVLLPSRRDLARILARLSQSGYPLQGFADHLVSEAIYLADPDANGIEIYADRPREEWKYREDRLQIDTLPLDVQSLAKELESVSPSWDGVPVGTRVGHIHLQVSNLGASEEFYREGLGFELVTRYGERASFLSAGGYHHHIGLNTWAGEGIPPNPADCIGFDRYSIILPSASALEKTLDHLTARGIAFSQGEGGWEVKDPDGIGVVLRLKE
jgi:catechol 2,3-dioxygenase